MFSYSQRNQFHGSMLSSSLRTANANLYFSSKMPLPKFVMCWVHWWNWNESWALLHLYCQLYDYEIYLHRSRVTLEIKFEKGNCVMIQELEILRKEMNQGLDDLESCLLGKTKLGTDISIEEFSFEAQRKIWKYLQHIKGNNSDEMERNFIYELQNRFSRMKEPIRFLSNDFKQAIVRIN